MKKLTLFLIVTISTILCSAQANTKTTLITGYHYKIKKGTVLHYGKKEFRKTGNNNTRASINQDADGKVNVLFYNAKIENEINATDPYKQHMLIAENTIPLIKCNDSIQKFYLQINRTDTFCATTWYISIPYRLTQYGALTIPFKYRWAFNTNMYGQKFDINTDASTNINIALYTGYKWGRSRFYYDATKSHNILSGMFLLFAGPSTVTLSSSNTSLEPPL
jgi:hypothetical protein